MGQSENNVNQTKARHVKPGRRIRLPGNPTIYTHMGRDQVTGKFRLGEGYPPVETTQVNGKRQVRHLTREEDADYARVFGDLPYFFGQTA